MLGGLSNQTPSQTRIWSQPMTMASSPRKEAAFKPARASADCSGVPPSRRVATLTAVSSIFGAKAV